MKYTFIQIVDSIFKNKHNWNNIDDISKEDNFFIINRKFGVKYIKQSNFFNNKFIDKQSVIDYWNIFFKNTKDVPQWYWIKKNKKDDDLSKQDRDLLKKWLKISDTSINFLYKNNKKELEKELINIKKFKK